MKTWQQLLLILLAWLGVAVLVTARVYFIEQFRDGMSYFELLIAKLPGWLLWAAATPLIFWTAEVFPLRKGNTAKALIVQIAFSSLFIEIYAAAFVVADTLIAGGELEFNSLVDATLANVQTHWLSILALYWIVLAIGYGLRLAFHREPPVPERFENSILIKTNYGFVLVEIEKYQYVKGGGKRIMFHTTGRNKHLDSNREALARGDLVEEHRYRPDRRIVIDLGKIRRAEQTDIDRFVFHIGYSHELYFNQEYYQKLGGWLPTPVVTFKKD